MTFRNLLLDVAVDIEWTSGAEFSIGRVMTDSGKVYRTAHWDNMLMRGLLRYSARSAAVWTEIDKMFQVCQAGLYSFKVRDPRKPTAAVGEGIFVAGQATLRITVGAYTIDKPITKLDATTTVVGGTANILTGVSGDGATSWYGKFYLCCIFADNTLETAGRNVSIRDGTYIAGYPDVPIMEVPDE
jgi:hypothetical protein